MVSANPATLPYVFHNDDSAADTTLRRFFRNNGCYPCWSSTSSCGSASICFQRDISKKTEQERHSIQQQQSSVSIHTVEFVHLGRAISVGRDPRVKVTRRLQRTQPCLGQYTEEKYDRPDVRLRLKVLMHAAEEIETLVYGCVT